MASDLKSASAATSTSAVSKSTSKPSYAGQVNRLKINKNNWIDATRKKKKIVPVSGSGVASVLEGVPKAKRDYWDISISRLKEGATEEKVKTHLQSQGIEVKEVFVFPSKIKGTVAAKVRVAIEHKDRILNGDLWPNGLQISSWMYKPKSIRNEATDKKQVDGQQRQ